MKQAAPSRGAAGSEVHGPIAAVLVWISVQLIPLALAAGDVALWARPATPFSNHALAAMLATQAAAAALLFPWLGCDLRTATMTVLCSGLFAQLAGFLGGAAGWQIALGIAQLWAWLIGLLMWSTPLRGPAALFGIALASSLSIGGIGVLYLHIDFFPADWPDLHTTIGWIALTVLVSGACGAAVSRIRKRPATGYPPDVHPRANR